jgi:hypothetical protein
MVHGSVVMKREAPGVGGEATHFSKSARSGAPPVRIIQIKNEQRYNRDAGEGIGIQIGDVGRSTPDSSFSKASKDS